MRCHPHLLSIRYASFSQQNHTPMTNSNPSHTTSLTPPQHHTHICGPHRCKKMKKMKKMALRQRIWMSRLRPPATHHHKTSNQLGLRQRCCQRYARDGAIGLWLALVGWCCDECKQIWLHYERSHTYHHHSTTSRTATIAAVT